MTPHTVMRAFAFAAAGLSTACDKSPTAPIPGPGREPGPAVVRSIEVAGPNVLAPGESAQFRLTAVLTDGSRRDMTNEAQWRSGGQLAATSNPGVMAGRESGLGYVIAEFGELQAPKEVLVLPTGTYRLMGAVQEAGTPVIDALVEVTSANGVRMTTTTDEFGTYEFYGVSGETHLRVMKDGYQPVARTAVIADQTVDNVELPLLAPRVEVSGNYTLTLTAADECRLGVGEGRVPEEARVRTYQAVVRQYGPRLAMMLSGATLRSGPIPGRVEPEHVLFNLGFVEALHDTDERLIVEKLATSGFLAIGGHASVTGSSNRLSGTLRGEFHMFETESIWSRSIAWCYSERHQFVLSR